MLASSSQKCFSILLQLVLPKSSRLLVTPDAAHAAGTRVSGFAGAQWHYRTTVVIDTPRASKCILDVP